MAALLGTELGAPASSRPHDLVERRPALPGYELGAALGRGGMGEVFRARRLADGVEVAVKMAVTNGTQGTALAERLAREASALKMLEHPSVLRVLDSGTTDDGRFFLVTELATGGDLAQRLQAGPLPVEEGVRLFREITAAVAAAHRAGILHRDLKPANVLLDADGHAHLADFSLARLLQPDGSPAYSLTGGGDVFGTPYYLAPEARRSVATADARADIFSLGVLLHEMLTGRVPIGHYVPASRVVKVSPAVDQLIARCLAENPAARPADAESLLKEFEVALRARRPLARRLLYGIVAVVLLIGCDLLWQAQHPQESVARKHSASQPAGATRARPWINSLGMKFIPVSDTKVLFSVWETRRQDFEIFASNASPFIARPDARWRHPPGASGPTHPVSGVDFPSAREFCDWLTKQERAAGLLGEGDEYRLPTDEEWSRAAGLPEEPGATPEEREAVMIRERGYFAWGRTLPPPENIPANFAGTESLGPGNRSQLRHRDAWPTTAPAGSFPANEFGLFDLSGNVAEWCSSSWNKTSEEKVLRGGAWNQSSPAALRLTTRQHALPVGPLPGAGFRVVLEKY